MRRIVGIKEHKPTQIFSICALLNYDIMIEQENHILCKGIFHVISITIFINSVKVVTYVFSIMLHLYNIHS